MLFIIEESAKAEQDFLKVLIRKKKTLKKAAFFDKIAKNAARFFQYNMN